MIPLCVIAKVKATKIYAANATEPPVRSRRQQFSVYNETDMLLQPSKASRVEPLNQLKRTQCAVEKLLVILPINAGSCDSDALVAAELLSAVSPQQNNPNG
jgi:hypothetical protein